MSKPQPVKSIANEVEADIRTKPKLIVPKIKANEKETVSSHARANRHNQFASKLLAQSSVVSQESSISAHGQESSDSVVEIDQLCVYGTIENVQEVSEEMKKKYGIYGGFVFDVDEYRVIFAGRHQIQFRNGFPVCLYVPPIYKSARDAITKKIQVLIERKIKDEKDPMQYPYLIIDPNNSLYPTYICTWIECKRKITLEHYIEYEQESNMALALGNAIHCYLEWLIRKEVQPEAPTEKEIRKLYENFIYEMFLIGLQFEIFVDMVEEGIVNLVQWYRKYVVQGSAIQLNKWEKKYLRITRVLGSEVMVKSQYFGIRGKVDGLFEGEYHDEKANVKYTVTIPFELKTGKKVLDSHKRQIDFYNLLLRENKLTPTIGLLYYSQSNTLEYRMENPLICFENINVHRNKIIINILNLYQDGLNIRLPGLPQTFDQCKLCDVTVQCAVTRTEPDKIKDLEDIGEETPQKYHPSIMERLKKLSILQVSYLKRWTLLLHLEECNEKSQNQKNKIKSYYSSIKMPLVEILKFTQHSPGQNITLTLIKKIESHEMSQQLDGYFKTGQKLRIFIPLIRLADGCRIVSTFKNTKKFQMQVEIRNQNVKFNRGKCGFLLEDQQLKEIEVQMEKYQNSFYNYTRGYCYKFVDEAEEWLKKIVIDETFEPSGEFNALQKDPEETKLLNDDQRLAFRRCVEQERFCLVEGMPGTGKTQLILKLIEYYYRVGKTVLVTSFTNQALSNILDREINDQKKIPIQHIIREGSKFGITEEYEHLSSQSQDHRSIEEYKAYFKSKRVWFVTISSLYIHHLPKKFDVVIIDEASQCLEANCLQALLKGQKFILIGDQRQLQPVVKSKEAIQKGMQVSLFERLCNLYPNMKATLKKQYRMSPAIMNLTNNLVYDGKLELANNEMKTRILKLPEQWREMTPQFLHNVVDPSMSLRFINYDSALSLFSEGDTINFRKIKRLLQIKIACCLYKQFRELGIKKEDILIISAYNSLVHQLVAALRKQKLIQSNNSDVLTIDKSQGTDKEIIIFIFHQGNKELIENYRRLNVALTRAKNKFIIVGSQKELSQLATWTGRLAKLLQPDQINIEKEFLEALLNENTI